jgi:hypothetical protein
MEGAQESIYKWREAGRGRTEVGPEQPEQAEQAEEESHDNSYVHSVARVTGLACYRERE